MLFPYGEMVVDLTRFVCVTTKIQFDAKMYGIMLEGFPLLKFLLFTPTWGMFTPTWGNEPI